MSVDTVEGRDLLARAAISQYLRGMADRLACVGVVAGRLTDAYQKGYKDADAFINGTEAESLGDALDNFIMESE